MNTQHTTRRLIGVMAAAMVASSAGQACGAAAEVRVLGAVGPAAAGELVMALPVGSTISAIDHVSASPGGRVLVVAQVVAPTWGARQATLVRDGGGQWRVAAVAGLTGVKQLASSAINTHIGGPIANDAGEVLAMATVSGLLPTGALTTSPALIRLNVDGTADILLRFNATTGPGVPAMPPHMSSLLFSSPTSDHWRFTEDGALFAGVNTGLLGPCFGDVEMGFRTFVQPRSGTTSPPPFGTAVPVSSGNAATTMSSGGFAAQLISSNGYTREGLRGVMMWDQWGLPQLAVRDGTTPIDGLTDEFVLETVGSSVDGANAPIAPGGSARVTMNSACRVAFLAKFGPIPPSPTGNTNQTMPISAPVGLFIKDPGHPARLVARPAWTNASATAVPQVAGAVITAMGTPVINRAGQVAFVATISGGRSAIMTTDRDGSLRLVALVNAPAGSPGGPDGPVGARYSSFVGEPTINSRGQIMFIAQTTQGAAVMGWDPTVGTSTLLTSGQTIDTRELGTRTVTMTTSLTDIGGRMMPGSGNNDGLATVLTDAGEAVLRVNSAGAPGAGMLAISVRIPTAVGACCTGSACVVKEQLDCGGAATSFAGRATVCAEPGRIGDSCCPADFDQSGAVGVQDLFDYLAAWSAQDGKANTDGVEGVGLGDLMLFLQAYLGGC